MNGAALVALLSDTMPRLAEAQEELRELDAALGDGDLGITINTGAQAVRTAVRVVADPTPSAVLRAAGLAFAAANPSTMAALVGGGLLAAAKTASHRDLDRASAIAVGRTVARHITTRGKANLGDKTILDALLPSLDALEQGGDDKATLELMVHAAERGVTDTASLVSQRGRAAWVGERGAGHPDPGATAYVRFLQSLAESWPTP